MTEGGGWPQQLSPTELAEWQRCLKEANRNNVFCHCRQCDSEWVASEKEACSRCGSLDVEAIACWQFPDG
ncbi:MAG: hypothetical protein AAFR31_07725 [Cyanobacteria bacterium J06627_8]